MNKGRRKASKKNGRERNREEGKKHEDIKGIHRGI